MNLERLADPFPLEDIEWRVSRAGRGSQGIYCWVLCYITARAVQKRLDEVCGPENWKLEEPSVFDVYDRLAFPVGISIRINEEWVTKWDVAAPPRPKGQEERDDPAKSGFSRALRRAGAQWGIGRYLYYLDETYAEVSEQRPEGRSWNYATLRTDDGKVAYYWKPPSLPAWALPKEPEAEVSKEMLVELVQSWREKFAADVESSADRREGFTRWVHSIVGEFPVADHACWTAEALQKCRKRIEETTDANGVDSDVPFEE